MEEPANIIRFGVFEVNLRAGELQKSGHRIRLQDQPFQILAALLESPGEIVTREELRRRLWTDDTYVDFDRSLNTAVAKLREALGDSPTHSRFIETLPRRGYRFVAPVHEPAGAQVRQTNPIRRYTAVAAIVVVGLTIVWFGRASLTTPEEPLELGRPIPLTSSPLRDSW